MLVRHRKITILKRASKKFPLFFIFFLPTSRCEYISLFVVEVVELVDTLS